MPLNVVTATISDPKVDIMKPIVISAGVLLSLVSVARSDEFPRFEAQEIDPLVGRVCYAVTTADVNGDGRLDVVALTEDSIAWYENPTWTKREILKGATEPDNVCIAAHDLDGDGRVDFAVGASWQPTNTQGGGTLQWAGRDANGEWRVHPLGSEPTLHRVRWGDLNGDGHPQLVVVPLQGRGTSPPNWGEGQGVRILAYSIPENPSQDSWPVEVVDDSLHTTHNFQLIDVDNDGRDEILVAAWEGVFLLDRDDEGAWTRTKLGVGNQEAQPFKGASELKLGRLADDSPYIATIEPWHGFQVVVYTPGSGGRGFVTNGLWDRQVIAEPLRWGHAVWCANLDDDGDDELIIGQRDANAPGTTGPIGPGIFVFDPVPGSNPLQFTRHTIDDGGMACEDACAADLDGDGRPEIIAGGRATHNVKIYWNRGTER